MVDSGATLSAISRELIEELGALNKVATCSHKITVADNRQVKVTH